MLWRKRRMSLDYHIDNHNLLLLRKRQQWLRMLLINSRLCFLPQNINVLIELILILTVMWGGVQYAFISRRKAYCTPPTDSEDRRRCTQMGCFGNGFGGGGGCLWIIILIILICCCCGNDNSGCGCDNGCGCGC